MECDEFKDKIAIITGAVGGIGRPIVERLAKKGAKVIAVDQHADLLHQMIEKLKSQDYKVWAFPLDISDHSAVHNMVEYIESEIGPIEILVNAASVLQLHPVTDLNIKDWNLTFAVNTTGVFNISQSVCKHMIQRKADSIVTVSSNAARMPRMSMAAYSSSKAATTMFMKCLGLEVAKHHTRCNVVSPGSTDTDMLKQLWTTENGERDSIEGALDTYRVGIPLQKLGQPADVCNTVLFLLSDQANHITLQDICVDGGATLGV